VPRRDGVGGSALVLSLEGEVAVARCPRLAAERDQLVFLDERPGAPSRVAAAAGGAVPAAAADLRAHAHAGLPLYAGGAAGWCAPRCFWHRPVVVPDVAASV
jgi:hypothetical protein